MEKLKWRMMMIIMVVVRMKVDSECCLEDERIALVELKAHINSIDHSTSSSWGTNLECCSWVGVGCNNNGRVAQLNLGQTDWTLDWITVDLQLNASLFLPFQQLDSLNLAGYNIVGCLPNHGFEKLSILAKLEHLDLSDNRLDNSILPSLSHLLSLKYLNLTSNKLRGTIGKSELNNLTSLRELDFTGNKIEGFGTWDGSEEPTLPNLEVLRLGFNVLNNTIFQLLSYLSNLKILGLEGNRLDRKIHTSELNNLRNLRELDISENAIEGFQSLLQGGKEFLKLEKLESLNLRINYFKNDALPFLRGLPSLRTLDMSYNQFKGLFNLEELDGLSNLEELDLSGNEITRFVSNKEDADYKGPANISILYLDNMTMTNENSNLIQQLGVVWPNLNTLSLRLNNLQGQTFDSNNIGRKVEEVYLDYCLIDEIFLQSLSRTFPSLKVLSLVDLRSTLPSQGFPTFDNLEHMYLNGTLFSNHSLPNLETMRSLKTLSLPKCGLSGKIYAGLCELKHLEQLDMQDNNLIGELPWCLANLTSLRLLTLAYNQLTGSISFSPLQSLTSLHYLDISNNLFHIPISLAPFFNHSLLKRLSLYNNTIFADTSSATMTPKFQLEYLYFRGFGEAGSIPKFLYYQHSLQEVLLSNINLRGNFPYWLLDNNTRLQSIFLPYNLLSGPLQLPSTPHLNLWYLGVFNNFFNGSIPAEMGTYLPGLLWLDLSMNSFDGTIPDSLCKPRIYMMDLSRNHISGTIPFCRENVSTRDSGFVKEQHCRKPTVEF